MFYFLGNYVSEYIEGLESLKTAGYKFQKNLIEALRKKINVEVYSVLAETPKKKGLVPSKRQIIQNKDESYLLKYINIYFIREIGIGIQTFCIFLFKSFKEKEKIYVLIYNLDLQFSIPMLILEKLGRVNFIPFVADLHAELPYRTLKYFFKRAMSSFIQKIVMKNAGKIIVINSCIAKDFKLKKYILIEGGVSRADMLDLDKNNDIKNKKIIMFTGNLDYLNGIEFCIESFNQIESKNIELYLYGNGPLADYILKECKRNKNIFYKGFMSNKEILSLQRKADFLIIPRIKSKKIFRYTFPSKLFEYMLSGTPVISTNIPGLKEGGYSDHIFVADTEDSSEFAKFIDSVIALDDKVLYEKGCTAQKFVLENKNWDMQADKIIKFIAED